MTQRLHVACISLLIATVACGGNDNDGNDGDSPTGGDPSNSQPDPLCPEAGKATLVFEIASAVTPGSSDVLRWALFTAMPPGGKPSAFGTAPSPVVFPVSLMDNSIDPGDYGISGCFDLAGDNMMGCDGTGDVSFIYPEMTGAPPFPLHTIAAGDVVTVDANLDTPAVTVTAETVSSLQLQNCP